MSVVDRVRVHQFKLCTREEIPILKMVKTNEAIQISGKDDHVGSNIVECVEDNNAALKTNASLANQTHLN